jgi:quinol monooxygenase YgiN
VRIQRELALPTVNEESGTRQYLMLVDEDDPNVVWWWMIYEDDEALRVHTEGQVHEVVAPRVHELSTSFEVHRLRLVAGKGGPLSAGSA